MARTAKKDSDEIMMIAAAFLAGEGCKQTRIAEILDISQAAVSRHLAKARQIYLREEVRFLRDKVTPGDMERVLQRVGRRELAEKLERFCASRERRAPALRVYACETPPGSEPARLKRMAELSRLAAPHIRDLILRSGICGVTWGGMLSMVAGALRDLSIAPPWNDTSEIQIVPLSGEPLGEQPTSYSSSSIAHALGVVVNDPAHNARSLAMVPAFIPDNFEDAQISGVWRLIRLVPAYAEIFGKFRRRQPDDQTLAFNLDTVLTSVGPASRPLGFGRGRLLETGNVKAEDMQKLIIGDMGGVCFERPGLTEAQSRKLTGVMDRWTGWSREHLDRCAARAAAADPLKGPPGVVVVSVGRERAEFLLEAVAQGCVNHLLIDDELQKEMEKLLDQRAK